MRQLGNGSGLPFEKWHGAGNDFVIADARAGAPWHRVLADSVDLSRISKAACDRHFGVGADGLLLATDDPHAPVAMRMWNPDGTESEMCGNGLRCFGAWMRDHGEFAVGTHWVATGAGILVVEVEKGGEISVEMGRPRVAPPAIPVTGALARDDGVTAISLPGWGTGDVDATCVSVGNPHAVIFVPNVDDVPLWRIGPEIERHPAFPLRTNVEVCHVIDRSTLAVRVWERGAGATLACGTGACAVMVAARLHGLVGPCVDIRLPGGTLRAQWHGGPGDLDYAVTLAGPAERTFVGTWFGA